MVFRDFPRSLSCLCLVLVLLIPAVPAEAILGLFEDKVVTEEERAETVERIQEVQEKLRLLQEKLRVLEQRKAAEEAGETGAVPDQGPEKNWAEVNEALVDPGRYGVYTYILFAGDADDSAAIGILEDLILTIETLPKTAVPTIMQNRFLVPLEQPMSSVDLGRQPYDFDLSQAYLQRFGLDAVGTKILLVSAPAPVDPYGTADPPPSLAVFPGEQSPTSLKALLEKWHRYAQVSPTAGVHPLGDLFLALLQDAGPARTIFAGERLVINFAP